MLRSRIVPIPVSTLLALIASALGSPVEASAQTLTLTVGGEATEFTVTHCRAEPYEAGNQPGSLRIEAEVTATGVFRGRPAALFLAKVTDAQADKIDLYLTELSPEVLAMPPYAAYAQLTEDHTAEWGRRGGELQREFEENLSQEGLTTEQMTKIGDEFGKKNAALDEEMAMALPYARLFGAITVDGTTISFVGSDQTSVHPRDGNLNPLLPELRGLEGAQAVARCGA